jgi:hypothetical protein
VTEPTLTEIELDERFEKEVVVHEWRVEQLRRVGLPWGGRRGALPSRTPGTRLPRLEGSCPAKLALGASGHPRRPVLRGAESPRRE